MAKRHFEMTGGGHSEFWEIIEFHNYGGNKRPILAPSLDAWLAVHIAITEAAKSLDDDDAVYDAFIGAKAKKLRAKVSPGYPKG